MKFKNSKKEGFSIIEIMVSFVIILVIVLLVGPNLFSMYEKSKGMAQVSDANSIISSIDMYNLDAYMSGGDGSIVNSDSVESFKEIALDGGYLSSWPTWVDGTITVGEMREIAVGQTDGVKSISQVEDYKS